MPPALREVKEKLVGLRLLMRGWTEEISDSAQYATDLGVGFSMTEQMCMWMC